MPTYEELGTGALHDHRFPSASRNPAIVCDGCGVTRQEALEELADIITHGNKIPPWTDNHELYIERRRQEAEARG